ncbi:spore maturation protein CgeB [Pseudarthrobacter sp. W1I19]|uniref:CgeB family protein n=1 Tax=Pseudarthrobacter sp. W1I19 TaxID=3042288 RepID=UPI002781ABAE|nr:glycosyltransferase [Pseudarthrobacter sp. W1I19]MDQ0922273.1 spore maturation protein CgeB [Pseudarthrobacter sp. W1I19]
MSQRLLLITPTFHGYYKSIARALEGVGYEVTSHCYDGFSKVRDKIRNKALFELPGRIGLDGTGRAEQWATARALQALEETRPHKLVVIKGDSLGVDFWAEVERRRLPRILWLYDDLARHRYDDDFLRSIGPVATYSRDEAAVLTSKGVTAAFLPNAFDPSLASPPAKRTPEIVFVGSRYPNRVALLEGLKRDGLPVRAYGRQWSRHAFDRLRTWEISRPDLPSERDIPLSQAYVVQAEAAAAINIHGLQAGLAMRTFEVPGMGGLQLIDRPDVAEFYEPGVEALVFGNPNELGELAARAIKDTLWAERLRTAGRKRTLAEHTFAHRMPILEALWH